MSVKMEALSMESPVLAAIFPENWNDGGEKEVSLTDVTAACLRRVGDFLEGSALVDLDREEAWELHRVANMLSILNLRAACELVLGKEFDGVDEAFDAHAFALQHGGEYLMLKAADGVLHFLEKWKDSGVGKKRLRDGCPFERLAADKDMQQTLRAALNM